MKKFLSLLLFFYSNFCLAQNKMEYANFIQTDTSVKWAAIYTSYVNLTPVSPNFNIRNFYINKLKQSGATVYIEDQASFAVTSEKINYAQYKTTIKPVDYNAAKMNWRFDYDEKHDASETIFKQESNTCDTCILSNKFSFFKIKQLLYYKDNQFKIQNILISPVIYKKQELASKEETVYFETADFAFNEIKTANTTIPVAAKFIGRSCNHLVLLPSAQPRSSENNILTLNNWSLSALLYKDIKRRILKAYDTRLSDYPDKKNILDYRKIEEYQNTPIEIAVYDSVGNFIKNVKRIREINLDSIYNYTLIQDLYFDFDKEILYSKLVALVPRISVVTSQGIFLGDRKSVV